MTKREARQAILTSAFNSIRLKLEEDKDRKDRIRQELESTGEHLGHILSRNEQKAPLRSGSQWLEEMIERMEKGERVMDMVSD